MEENNQSLNEIVEITKKEKRENDGNNVTENMSKLLEQISEKDKKIFNLQKEINELNNKINKDLDNKDTQNMLSTINEKELKKHINELQEKNKMIKEFETLMNKANNKNKEKEKEEEKKSKTSEQSSNHNHLIESERSKKNEEDSDSHMDDSENNKEKNLIDSSHEKSPTANKTKE